MHLSPKNSMETVSFTSYTSVNKNNTATALGSGDMEVFATPAMTALMENAATNAAAIYIKNEMDEENLTSVGISLNISHEKASAVGKKIKALALLTAVDGRKLTFKVSAFEESDTNETLIGQGTHERFIVNREKFMNKL